jgi:hypothetical protein
MGVSDEAKNVIPLKFLRKIKNFFFPLVNSSKQTFLFTIFSKTQIYARIYFRRIPCHRVVYGWDGERTTASYEKR